MDTQTRIVAKSRGGVSQRTIVIIFLALAVLGGLVYYFFFYDKDEDEESSSSNTSCTAQTTEATCISPCVWDGATCKDAPPDFSPQDKIDDISGLAARYLPSGYDTTTKKWKDADGGKVFDVLGTLTKSSDEKHVSGDTLTKFTLPAGLYDRRYTLFTVAKYNGNSKKRIFTSSGGDWYSGHDDGKSGVAKHESVLTEDIDHYGDGWVVSCDQRDMYRANGIRLSGLHYGEGLPENIGVNIKSGWESDFAIGEILVYSRELTMDEIQIIEKALLDKYVVPPKTYFGGELTNAGVDDIYDAEVDCGENSALTGVRVQEGNVHKYKCMFNMDDFDNRGYTRDNIEDTKNGAYMEDMANNRMDCSSKGLQGYKFQPSSDDTKVFVRYKCAGGLVDENECEDKTSDYMNAADIVSHVIDCGSDDKVLTSMRFKKDPDDSTKGRYEYTCCKPKGY
jgi:hypothetical protein